SVLRAPRARRALQRESDGPDLARRDASPARGEPEPVRAAGVRARAGSAPRSPRVGRAGLRKLRTLPLHAFASRRHAARVHRRGVASPPRRFVGGALIVLSLRRDGRRARRSPAAPGAAWSCAVAVTGMMRAPWGPTS